MIPKILLKVYTYLPLIGFLSMDELLPVRPVPLVTGVEILRGEDDPKPTGVCCLLMRDARAPVRIEEVLRTFEPLGESSEFRDRLDPVREAGLEPPRLPGIPDCLRWNPICWS